MEKEIALHVLKGISLGNAAKEAEAAEWVLAEIERLASASTELQTHVRELWNRIAAKDTALARIIVSSDSLLTAYHHNERAESINKIAREALEQ